MKENVKVACHNFAFKNVKFFIMTKQLYKLLSFTSNIAVMCIMLSRKESAKHQIFKFKTHLEGRASVFTSVVTDVLQSKLTNSRQRADAQKSNTHSAWIVPGVTAFPCDCEESWMMLTGDKSRKDAITTRLNALSLECAAGCCVDRSTLHARGVILLWMISCGCLSPKQFPLFEVSNTLCNLSILKMTPVSNYSAEKSKNRLVLVSRSTGMIVNF